MTGVHAPSYFSYAHLRHISIKLRENQSDSPVRTCSYMNMPFSHRVGVLWGKSPALAYCVNKNLCTEKKDQINGVSDLFDITDYSCLPLHGVHGQLYEH